MLKIQRALTAILITMFLSFTGCTRYYYRPNAVNAPMLREKDDLNIVAGFGLIQNYRVHRDGNYSQSQSDGFEFNLQTAYSPIRYLGIMANYSGYRYPVNEKSDQVNDLNAKSHLLEFGLGGYYPVAEVRKGWGFIIDLYSGYGGGHLQADINMDMSRLFVQPGISFRTPYFDVGFHQRISGLKFSHVDANGRSNDYLLDHDLIGIGDHRTYFWEPAITLRGGYKFIKFQLQQQFSTSFDNVKWNYRPYMFTAGIMFSIDELVKVRNRNTIVH